MKLNPILIIAALFFSFQSLQASSKIYTENMDTLPYYQIPDAPEMYNAATVTARMIDGLGFRYHWATEGLRTEDLAFEPGNEGQSCSEVLEHILGLSRFMLRTIKAEIHDNNYDYPAELTWEQQREATLQNFKMASDILKETGDVSELNIIFKRKDTTNEFPFWNLINGPIADAIYHSGQIVSFRRSAGNPINPNVSVFRGEVKN